MSTPEGRDQVPESLTPEGRAIVRRLDEVVETLRQFGVKQTEGEERLANHDELIAESRARLQEGTERLAKSELHLGYLRGAHASNAARRDADLIAEDMGYQLVNQLPRGMLISFANMARASGKHENDVRSFREADLIMLVRDADGQPAYVAVEASFTVAARDIERARRNAEYLHEFTGLKAVAAVAGVEITRGQHRNASAAGVHCYTIPARDLEAD